MASTLSFIHGSNPFAHLSRSHLSVPSTSANPRIWSTTYRRRAKSKWTTMSSSGAAGVEADATKGERANGGEHNDESKEEAARVATTAVLSPLALRLDSLRVIRHTRTITVTISHASDGSSPSSEECAAASTALDSVPALEALFDGDSSNASAASDPATPPLSGDTGDEDGEELDDVDEDNASWEENQMDEEIAQNQEEGQLQQRSASSSSGYTLEVTSPGAPTNLQHGWELEVFRSFPVRVTLLDDTKPPVLGTLAECDDDVLRVSIKGRIKKIARTAVASVVLVTASDVA